MPKRAQSQEGTLGQRPLSFDNRATRARSAGSPAPRRTRAISNPRSLPPACLPLNVFAQCSIDPCLITFIGFRVALEPGDDIGVQAECQLLLDRSIEQPTRGAGPVENLRRVRRIDDAIGQGR